MSDRLILERVEANLTRLRLPRIGQILQPVMKTADEKNKSYLAFLDELLEEEVAQKEQRRIETNLRISGLLSRVARKCTKSGREKCTTLSSFSIHINALFFVFFFQPITFPPNIQHNTVVKQPV